MNQIVLDRFITSDRLSVYTDLEQYKQNLRFSKSYYIPLSVLEVASRNSIDFYLSTKLGTDWINDDAFLQKDSISFRVEAISKILKRREILTKGKIIAELSFGFWTSLFKLPYKKHWRTKDIKNVFPNMPSINVVAISRDTIFSDLDLVRKFRNRLFHNEKVIDKDEFTTVEQTVRKLLSYFDNDLVLFVDEVNGQCP